MLADQQHAIHCQIAPAERQRIRNRFRQSHAVFTRKLLPDVPRRDLVNVQARKFQIRERRLTQQVISLQNPADDHIRMRVMCVDRHHRRDLLRRRAF